jgi:HEAT repeat protein
VVVASIIACLLGCLHGHGQETKSIDELMHILVTERRSWNEASDALVDIGEPAVESLVDVLKDEALDAWPRRKAAMTLRRIKSVNAIEPLMEVFLDKEADPTLRANAGSALEGFKLARWEAALIELSKEDGAGIRIVALARLAEISSETANEAIVTATRDEDSWVRVNALTLLENIESDRTLRIFIDALKDDAWSVRRRASHTLVKKGEPCVEPLMRVLKDDAWPATGRWNACWILGRIESQKALGALTDALRDESWLIRNEAAVSLARIKHEMSIEPLIRMLKDEKHHAREEAAWILDEMRREEATEPLIQMLNGRDEGAWMAAVALGKIAPRRAVPSLTNALEDKDIKIRRAAAWALCNVESIDAVKPLLAALKDDDEEVRYWAAEALKEKSHR